MRIIAHSKEAIEIDKVFIDGVQCGVVVEMDPEEGWARRYMTDEKGNIRFTKDGAARIEMVMGVITYTKRTK